jgi:hypothetical protein
MSRGKDVTRCVYAWCVQGVWALRKARTCCKRGVLTMQLWTIRCEKRCYMSGRLKSQEPRAGVLLVAANQCSAPDVFKHQSPAAQGSGCCGPG